MSHTLALLCIVGSAGVVLIIAGLVGGGFTFAGAKLPKVGKVARIFSLIMGMGLLTTAVLGHLDPSFNSAAPGHTSSQPSPSVMSGMPAPPSATPGVPVPPTIAPVPDPSSSAAVTAPLSRTAGNPPSNQPITASVTTPQGYVVNVRSQPRSSAPVVTQLQSGDQILILCAMEGDSVRSELTGTTSNLWDGVTDNRGSFNGFIPHVYVNAATSHMTMTDRVSHTRQ